MSTAILSLGSNLGDRYANITAMKEALEKISTKRIACSPLYETVALEVKEKQRDYYNLTVRIETDETPLSLLKKTQNIEKELGRNSKGEKLSRTADIDILLFDNLVIDLPELTVPHPRMFFRKFAIEGVKAVAGDFVNPLTGKKFANYGVCGEILQQETRIIEQN